MAPSRPHQRAPGNCQGGHRRPASLDRAERNRAYHEHALAREPASVQERWFARLYLLKPLVFGVFGLFWLATGLISFGPGWDIGMGLMREGGVREPFASLSIIAGASADVLIGAAILYRPTSRYGLYAALFISVTYLIIGSILVPRLWTGAAVTLAVQGQNGARQA